MATTPDIDETKIASHTLAYLRSLDRKFDLVVDVLQGHGERSGRLDRDQGETRRNLGEIRRDITEVKGDTALLDNKEMFDRGRGRHRHPDRHQERQAPRHRWNLTYVTSDRKLTYMEKTQIYFRKEELAALREAAARSGRSVAELVRDAVRKVVLKPPAAGPVAIWDGEPKRASIEHDSVHDEP